MRITLNGYVVPSSDQWLYDWFKIEAISKNFKCKSLSYGGF